LFRALALLSSLFGAVVPVTLLHTIILPVNGGERENAGAKQGCQG
jgi:hypothetical protein